MKLSDRVKGFIGIGIALGIVAAIVIIFFFVNMNYNNGKLHPKPVPTITNDYADVRATPKSDIENVMYKH